MRQPIYKAPPVNPLPENKKTYDGQMNKDGYETLNRANPPAERRLLSVRALECDPWDGVMKSDR